MSLTYKFITILIIFFVAATTGFGYPANNIEGIFYDGTHFVGTYTQQEVETKHDGKMTKTNFSIQIKKDNKNIDACYSLMTYGPTKISSSKDGYISATSLTNAMNGHLSVTYIVPQDNKLSSLGTATANFENSKTGNIDYTDYENDLTASEKNAIIKDIIQNANKYAAKDNDNTHTVMLIFAIDPSDNNKNFVNASLEKNIKNISENIEDQNFKKLIHDRIKQLNE